MMFARAHMRPVTSNEVLSLLPRRPLADVSELSWHEFVDEGTNLANRLLAASLRRTDRKEKDTHPIRMRKISGFLLDGSAMARQGEWRSERTGADGGGNGSNTKDHEEVSRASAALAGLAADGAKSSNMPSFSLFAKRCILLELLHNREKRMHNTMPRRAWLDRFGFWDFKVVGKRHPVSGENIFHAAARFGDILYLEHLLNRNAAVVDDDEDEDGDGLSSASSSIEPNAVTPSKRHVVPAKLKIFIKSASGLPKSDLLGLSDPYAIVRVGPQDVPWNQKKVSFSTSVQYKTLEPVWAARFEVATADLSEASDAQLELDIRVYDKDAIGSDDLLGTCRIPILRRNAPEDDYPLQQCSTGEGLVCVSWQTAYRHNRALVSDDNQARRFCQMNTREGHNALTLAVENGHGGVAAFLIRSGLCTSKDHDDAAQDLVNRSVAGDRGLTPLMYACLNGDKETAKLLLAFGADPRRFSSLGQPCLLFATFGGKHQTHIGTFATVFKSVASHSRHLLLSLPDKHGWSPLHALCQTGAMGNMRWGAGRGALLPNTLGRVVTNGTTGRLGLSLMHLAAWNLSLETLRLFLQVHRLADQHKRRRSRAAEAERSPNEASSKAGGRPGVGETKGKKTKNTTHGNRLQPFMARQRKMKGSGPEHTALDLAILRYVDEGESWPLSDGHSALSGSTSFRGTTSSVRHLGANQASSQYTRALQCIMVMAAANFTANTTVGALCQRVFDRILLTGNIAAVAGMLRSDDNQINLRIHHVQWARGVSNSQATLNSCTLCSLGGSGGGAGMGGRGVAGPMGGCDQHMYYCRASRTKVCQVCRDCCFGGKSVSRGEPSDDGGSASTRANKTGSQGLCYLGFLEGGVCECQQLGTMSATDGTQKLTLSASAGGHRCRSMDRTDFKAMAIKRYVPQGLLVPADIRARTIKQLLPLIEELAARIHGREKQSKEREGWTFGQTLSHDFQTDPKLAAKYTDLAAKDQEDFRSEAITFVATVTYSGYNIIGPLPKPEGPTTFPKDLENLAKFLAHDKHERWAESKVLSGWHYAPVWLMNAQPSEKLHSRLMPYELLDNFHREKLLVDERQRLLDTIDLGYRVITVDRGKLDVLSRQYNAAGSVDIARKAAVQAAATAAGLTYDPSDSRANWQRRSSSHSSQGLNRKRGKNKLKQDLALMPPSQTTSAAFSEAQHRTRELTGTLLLAAARWALLPIIQELLKEGVQLNKQDRFGYTALMLAVKRDHRIVARFLVDNGANLEMRNIHHFSALMLASYLGNVYMIQLLLQNGADVLATDHRRMMSIHHAAYMGRKGAVSVLGRQLGHISGLSVDICADVDGADVDGHSRAEHDDEPEVQTGTYNQQKRFGYRHQATAALPHLNHHNARKRKVKTGANDVFIRESSVAPPHQRRGSVVGRGVAGQHTLLLWSADRALGFFRAANQRVWSGLRFLGRSISGRDGMRQRSGGIRGTSTRRALFLSGTLSQNMSRGPAATSRNAFFRAYDASLSAMPAATIDGSSAGEGAFSPHELLLDRSMAGIVDTAMQRKRFDGYSPLALAVKAGHLDVIKALIGLGADPTAVDGTGLCPYDRALLKSGKEEEKSSAESARDEARTWRQWLWFCRRHKPDKSDSHSTKKELAKVVAGGKVPDVAPAQPADVDDERKEAKQDDAAIQLTEAATSHLPASPTIERELKTNDRASVKSPVQRWAKVKESIRDQDSSHSKAARASQRARALAAKRILHVLNGAPSVDEWRWRKGMQTFVIGVVQFGLFWMLLIFGFSPVAVDHPRRWPRIEPVKRMFEDSINQHLGIDPTSRAQAELSRQQAVGMLAASDPTLSITRESGHNDNVSASFRKAAGMSADVVMRKWWSWHTEALFGNNATDPTSLVGAPAATMAHATLRAHPDYVFVGALLLQRLQYDAASDETTEAGETLGACETHGVEGVCGRTVSDDLDETRVKRGGLEGPLSHVMQSWWSETTESTESTTLTGDSSLYRAVADPNSLYSSSGDPQSRLRSPPTVALSLVHPNVSLAVMSALQHNLTWATAERTRFLFTKFTLYRQANNIGANDNRAKATTSSAPGSYYCHVSIRAEFPATGECLVSVDVTQFSDPSTHRFAPSVPYTVGCIVIAWAYHLRILLWEYRQVGAYRCACGRSRRGKNAVELTMMLLLSFVGLWDWGTLTLYDSMFPGASSSGSPESTRVLGDPTRYAPTDAIAARVFFENDVYSACLLLFSCWNIIKIFPQAPAVGPTLTAIVGTIFAWNQLLYLGLVALVVVVFSIRWQIALFSVERIYSFEWFNTLAHDSYSHPFVATFRIPFADEFDNSMDWEGARLGRRRPLNTAMEILFFWFVLMLTRNYIGLVVSNWETQRRRAVEAWNAKLDKTLRQETMKSYQDHPGAASTQRSLSKYLRSALLLVGDDGLVFVASDGPNSMGSGGGTGAVGNGELGGATAREGRLEAALKGTMDSIGSMSASVDSMETHIPEIKRDVSAVLASARRMLARARFSRASQRVKMFSYNRSKNRGLLGLVKAPPTGRAPPKPSNATKITLQQDRIAVVSAGAPMRSLPAGGGRKKQLPKTPAPPPDRE